MPEDKKKPAKKAAAKRATARKTTARKTGASKGASGRGASARSKAPAKPATRKTPARKPAPGRKPAAAEESELEQSSVDRDEDDAPLEQRTSAPIVIGAGASRPGEPVVAASSETVAIADAATGEAVAVTDQAPDEPPVPERYPEDIPVMVVSALLAVSVFLPWYKLTSAFRQTTVTASGWETGTWGPMIFFLGLASLAIAVFRRAGVRVGLPVADSHLHEGIGWAAIIGAVIKLRAVPKEQGIQMGWNWGIIVAIVAAFALAFLAGRMSGSMTFTTIPGWFRGRAGKIGLAVLLLAIAGSALFGITQNVSPYALATGRPTTDGGGDGGVASNVLRDEFPKCAEGFPRPADAKPREGVEQKGQSPCVFTFSTAETPDELLKFYTSELKKDGWSVQALPSRGEGIGHAMTFSSPKCGSMSMQRAQGASESNVIVAVGGPCPTFQPGGSGSTPTPSPS
ncbi:MAG TPA: hypothetical protein VM841_03235 [Actinomycetota bacterium]|nr:hypothetical protein [Actinomycetota bacterium]